MNGMSKEEVSQLLQRAKNGDTEAFATVYKELYTPVFRYIYLRTREREQARDLTQDVFLKVFRGIDEFEVRDVHPLGYFFTVARNTIIDEGRKKRSVNVSDEDLVGVPDQSISPTDRFDQLSKYHELLDVILLLPEEQRIAIERRYFHDVPYEIIAHELGKTETAVRQLVSRGLKTVRTHFYTKDN